jgi:hypothetical protein
MMAHCSSLRTVPQASPSRFLGAMARPSSLRTRAVQYQAEASSSGRVIEMKKKVEVSDSVSMRLRDGAQHALQPAPRGLLPC